MLSVQNRRGNAADKNLRMTSSTSHCHCSGRHLSTCEKWHRRYSITGLRSASRAGFSADFVTSNPQVYRQAVEVLGHDLAIVALALTAERNANGSVANPGGYLRELTNRSCRGTLRLRPLSLWHGCSGAKDKLRRRCALTAKIDDTETSRVLARRHGDLLAIDLSKMENDFVSKRSER